MHRPPIITILGHVDHGKTTLLDYIRKTSITKGEVGGITQRIGGYEVTTDIKGYHTNKITFIDTPGHEVFSQLRARGANVADIAILLIDAKDSIKPQTIESISHIKASGIPFIVALNKIELPEANQERVKNDLLKHEVVVEEKGGKVPLVAISARTGKGVHELLESILLIASELNLSYEQKGEAHLFIIETKKDKRGVVASCIIKNGTVKVGETLYLNKKPVKVRSLANDRGVSITEAIPSMPFELSGFGELPQVGAILTSSPKSEGEQATQSPEILAKKSLEELLAAPSRKKLPLIIKTDAQGSAEAIRSSLAKRDEVEIVLIGVGEINKSDIFLAKSAKAIVISFNARVTSDVADLAKQEKVIIKSYQIIYEMLDELTEVTDLIREKEEREKNAKGEARVLANFLIGGQTVYGVRVTKGRVNNGDNVEIYREGKLIGKTKLVSLRVRAKVVGEVKKDQEAGMAFEPALDIAAQDMVKFIL